MIYHFRGDHNTGNSMPYSLQIMCGFFYDPQGCKPCRAVSLGLWFKYHPYPRRLESKGKGKVTLFNVGSSFTYEAGINGSRRCILYPPPSVSAPF